MFFFKQHIIYKSTTKGINYKDIQTRKKKIGTTCSTPNTKTEPKKPKGKQAQKHPTEQNKHPAKQRKNPGRKTKIENLQCYISPSHPDFTTLVNRKTNKQ
jgi:hypothetical protein